jgi:broad specificity phosphatase PhoE
MSNINLFVVRHGETARNRTDLIGQDPDEPLNETGKKQAHLLWRRFVDQKLTFDYAHCSTHLRARSTALIALGIGTATHRIGELGDMKGESINYSDALIEYSPGDLRGKKRSEFYADPKVATKFAMLNVLYPFPNGETLQQVERRMGKFVEDAVIYNKEVLALAKKQDPNVLIVSHGMSVKGLLRYAMGFDASMLWKVRIDNTSISHIRYNTEQGFFIHSINDCGHLLGQAG